MNLDIFKELLTWFKGQPFSNVISFLQFGLIAVSMYYAGNVLIPGERKAILDSSEQQAKAFVEALDRQDKGETTRAERNAQSFEKALDRVSNRTTIGSTAHGQD